MHFAATNLRDFSEIHNKNQLLIEPFNHFFRPNAIFRLVMHEHRITNQSRYVARIKGFGCIVFHLHRIHQSNKMPVNVLYLQAFCPNDH